MKMKIFTPLLSLGMALCAFNFAQAQSSHNLIKPFLPSNMHQANRFIA